MPKYKLIKDLPFQKADETEWEINKYHIASGEGVKNDSILFETKGELTGIEWFNRWGDPITSGWFEEVKPKRWRAESGCYYYCILASGVKTLTKEAHVVGDDLRYETGNYFRTEEQAEEAGLRIKKLLAEYQEEICPSTNS